MSSKRPEKKNCVRLCTHAHTYTYEVWPLCNTVLGFFLTIILQHTPPARCCPYSLWSHRCSAEAIRQPPLLRPFQKLLWNLIFPWVFLIMKCPVDLIGFLEIAKRKLAEWGGWVVTGWWGAGSVYWWGLETMPENDFRRFSIGEEDYRWQHLTQIHISHFEYIKSGMIKRFTL